MFGSSVVYNTESDERVEGILHFEQYNTVQLQEKGLKIMAGRRSLNTT